VTLPEVARYRLTSQQLADSKLQSAGDIIKWLGAVQGQEYAQTKWGLGLRLKNLSDDIVEQDFTNGKIIRTHLLRPTWHLVSVEDIRWLLMLTAPRVNAINAYMYRQLELDNTIFKRSHKILEKSLQGGKQLTREAINESFKRNKIEAEGHRLSYIMMYAELAGLICSGARQGNQFTYALLDERIPPSKSISRDEALAELTKRYFTSRGPATIKDFSTWSGLTLTECKKGIEITKNLFEKELVDRNEYYFTESILINKKQIHDIHLLPIYDEFIMGYKDRSALMIFKSKLKSISKFHYNCMVVYDGQIFGTWKRSFTANAVNVEFDFFRPPDKNQRKALSRAVHRLGEFTNMTVNDVST
jgi:hypothetical protein